MTAMRVLNLPNRAGKTYNGLKWLHDHGGGVFITQEGHFKYINQMCETHGFKNISIVEISSTVPIVVDNIDSYESMVTTTFPTSLSWKE